jgi:hypothetical protein
MATAKPRAFDFRGGLNTTRLDQTGDFPVYREFQNIRTDRGAAERRGGKVRLSYTAGLGTCADFDGTDDYVTFPPSSVTYPLGTAWTIETLFQVDDLSAQRHLLGRIGVGNACVNVYVTTAGVLTVVLVDSAAATTTLTVAGLTVATTYGVQIKRDGANVTLWCNGTTDTDTMSATNALSSNQFLAGQTNSGGWWDGPVEYVRMFSYARPTTADIYCRLLNPRAPGVLADWVFELDGNNWILDRGPRGLHATREGSLATAHATLARNHAPILGLGQARGFDGASRVYMVAGNRVFPVVT